MTQLQHYGECTKMLSTSMTPTLRVHGGQRSAGQRLVHTEWLKSGHTTLSMHYPGRELIPLPKKPSNADDLDPSLFKIGFVSFKVSTKKFSACIRLSILLYFTVGDSLRFCAIEQISKYVESLTIGRKGVRFPHGPD